MNTSMATQWVANFDVVIICNNLYSIWVLLQVRMIVEQFPITVVRNESITTCMRSYNLKRM